MRYLVDPFPALCIPDGVHQGEIGIGTSFNILTFPEEGGGVPIGAFINGPGKQSEASLKQIENNTFQVDFIPHEHGTHNAVITFEVTKHIHIRVEAWHPDPLQCIAYGPGLTAGEQFGPAEFTIESRNKLGERIPVGGHNFHGKVKDPLGNEIPISIKDNEDGTYTATYTPFHPGDHVVEVLLDQDHIKDSPFTVPIDDSSETANAGKSYAEGPGLENNANNSSQRHPATFKIYAVDKDGNPKKMEVIYLMCSSKILCLICYP